jgi:hypothetical protein
MKTIEEIKRTLTDKRGTLAEIRKKPEISDEDNARALVLSDEITALETELAEQAERADKEKEEAEKRAADEEAARKKAEADLEAERLKSINVNKTPVKEKTELYDRIRSVDSGKSQKITLQRAPIDGDTGAMSEVIPLNIAGLDILGKEPLYVQMGATVMAGLKGTINLPYEDPIIADLYAELAPVAGDVITPEGILVQPHRFSVQKTFTLETMNSATDAFLASVLTDMVKGTDRRITAEIYTKILGYASEVAAADSISKGGFDALMAGAEVEGAGAMFSPRATFFEAKSVAIDAGSGRFLVEMIGDSIASAGRTYDGVPYWYSSLFVDPDIPAAQKYFVYGAPEKVLIGDYGTVEIIIDKFTKAAEGQVIVTVNKIADVKVLNPNAFAKSVDLLATP